MGSTEPNSGDQKPEEDKDEKEELELKKKSSPSSWSSKQMTTFVSSIAALIAALGAWHRPTSEPVAEAMYKELSLSDRICSQQITQNHDDILALRIFLYQYLASQGINPDRPELSRLVPVVSPVGSVVPPPGHAIQQAADLFNPAKNVQPTAKNVQPRIGQIDPKKMPTLPSIGPATIEPHRLPSIDIVKKKALENTE